MDKASMEVRAQGWIQAIHEVNVSGTGAEAWCREHGIARSTYYRWKKKLRENALQEMGSKNSERESGIERACFAEVVIPKNNIEDIVQGMPEKRQRELEMLRIQSAGIVIEVPLTAEEAEITKILRAVRNAG